MGSPGTSGAVTGLRLALLPAGQGDSILIEYGDPAAPRRVLIDGGPSRSYRGISATLAQIPPDRRRLDLLVLTHVDADHIEGVIRLLNDAALAVEVDEVWFNGYEQLPPDDELGPPQGEILSALLERRGIPWNTVFGSAAVQRRRGDRLPRVELPDGLALTVLAPDEATLAALRPVWERECRAAGIAPGSARDALALLAESARLNPLDSYLDELDVDVLAAQPQPTEDGSATNASSIVLLAEYGDASVLLAGDSTPTVLTAGVERLLAERDRPFLEVEAFKLPHHGSRYNVTRDLLELVRSPIYLVSTDGAYFGHPDSAAVARLLVHGQRGSRIVFNYRTRLTECWSEPALAERYGFHAEYPRQGTEGAWLDL
jgi:beta-lactamase superfamily II metal-dependent hydrolase